MAVGESAEAPAKGLEAGLAVRLDKELGELRAILPGLAQDLESARGEFAQADIIRRDVALNPTRFSPQEREHLLDRAQSLGVRKENLDTILEATQERVALLEEVLTGLRQAGRNPGPGGSGGGSGEVYKAVEDERLRLARELHDGPAQVLSNLVLEADILERLLKRDPALVPGQLQEFKNSVRNAVADMRRFLFELRPMALDDLGLIATMRRFQNEYQDRTGVVCRFNVTGEERRLDPDLEGALYRIIQEALTNVQRHSRARTVEVALDIHGERIFLRIRDDGVGFDTKIPRPDGTGRLGIVGMRERAAGLGGRLEVISEPGSGTEVVAEFQSPEMGSSGSDQGL